MGLRGFSLVFIVDWRLFIYFVWLFVYWFLALLFVGFVCLFVVCWLNDLVGIPCVAIDGCFLL